jgi:hypothetical protein
VRFRAGLFILTAKCTNRAQNPNWSNPPPFLILNFVGLVNSAAGKFSAPISLCQARQPAAAIGTMAVPKISGGRTAQDHKLGKVVYFQWF